MGLKTSKIGGLKSHQKLYGNILVGLSFMALVFITVKTFAPDVASNADTNNASVEAGPYIVSISADQATNINITPTATQTVYTGTNTITYTNTCPYGFNVTMSSVDDNTSLIRLGDDTAVKEIPSTTTTSLTDSTWGFSIDGGTTYKPIPAISSPTDIINTFEATTNPIALDLIYGVKANNELPSGSYTRDVVYTVSAKPQCLTYGVTWDFDDGTGASGATYPETMNFGQTINLSGLTPIKEGYKFTGWSNGTNTFTGTETDADINPSSAPSLTMTAQWKEKPTMQTFKCSDLENVGDSIVLRDIRDDNYYTVKKLADDRCWMTENLRIINKTISSTDSNLPAGTTWTIPASSASGFDANNTNNAYYDSTYGGYYTFYTATAGWGTGSVTSGYSPKDICPKGWRLPTGGSGGELEKLYGFYNSSALIQGEPGFVTSGYTTNGRLNVRSDYYGGHFWSGSVQSSDNAYGLFFLGEGGLGSQDYGYKRYGRPMHCIADETMQRYDVSKLRNTGDTILLADERDDNRYFVRRVADGKVWMTQNLRIINKKLDSTTSDLPDDYTWTIPASSMSGWSWDTNNAYLGGLGGYYPFYTATAGWGSKDIEGGDAPMSICPKNWKLPTTNEYTALANEYGNSPSRIIGESNGPTIILNGLVGNGNFSNSAHNGYYWTATSYSGYGNYAYFFYINDNWNNTGEVNPSNSNVKTWGLGIRCMARE